MGLDLVEMVMELEKEFELDMPDDDLRHCALLATSFSVSRIGSPQPAASRRLASSKASSGSATSRSSSGRQVCRRRGCVPRRSSTRISVSASRTPLGGHLTYGAADEHFKECGFAACGDTVLAA